MHLIQFKIFRYRNTYYIFLVKKHRLLTLLGKFSYAVNTVSGSNIIGFYLNLKKIRKLLYIKNNFYSLRDSSTFPTQFSPRFVLLLATI